LLWFFNFTLHLEQMAMRSTKRVFYASTFVLTSRDLDLTIPANDDLFRIAVEEMKNLQREIIKMVANDLEEIGEVKKKMRYQPYPPTRDHY